jgi:hypothetical protein
MTALQADTGTRRAQIEGRNTLVNSDQNRQANSRSCSQAKNVSTLRPRRVHNALLETKNALPESELRYRSVSE